MTALAGIDTSRWLPFPPAPDAPLRLYCLPHAGGSASAYRPWIGRLGAVAVCPVQPPGRGGRLRETPHTRMATLVGELADVIGACDGPFAVYGHSLGALAGFELLREIRRRGGRLPQHFVLSGCTAPGRPEDDGDPNVPPLTEGEAVALLRSIGGTPEWLLKDREMLNMILPAFVADFQIKQTYVYSPELPLPVPITAIAADADPRATTALTAGWRAHTQARFAQHTLRGGHFAVLEQSPATLAHLRSALAPWVAGTELRTAG